ncbi:MAG: GntR family transcriptional regulator [Lachnospiraceae bacterium]|nr:GntR family transcriptional regulator [Lachnospiraceae bacterium]
MFKIDIMSRVPVYEQIIEQMEKFILTGILSAKEQVPSVRSLSVELSVNPNTIQKAYSDLDRRGIIYSVPGRGCFVAENAKELLSGAKRNELSELEQTIYELLLAGISKDEIIECLNKAIKRKDELK